MPQFSSERDIFDEARPWQWRVLRASLGTTTGLIVMAIIAKQPKAGPRLGLTCDIDKEGGVWTEVTTPGSRTILTPLGNKNVKRTHIGTVTAVRDNLRRLADYCKLSDGDREALFDQLRKWIRKDERATSG